MIFIFLSENLSWKSAPTPLPFGFFDKVEEEFRAIDFADAPEINDVNILLRNVDSSDEDSDKDSDEENDVEEHEF